MHDSRQSNPLALLKGIIWLYFWLIFAEGILRKWFLPGYSDIIFIIRDPLVILAFLMSIQLGVFPFRPSVVILVGIAMCSLIFSLTTDTPLKVVLYGLRTNYLHLPFIFLMGGVLNRDDVVKFGKWSIIVLIPIVALMTVQFRSAPSAWVNVAVGAEVSGQLRGAMGKIRPPGPFSFIAGAVMYFGLAWSFVLNGWLQPRDCRRIWVILATLAVGLAIPVSISRSLLLALLTGSMAAFVAMRHEPSRIFGVVVPMGLAGLVLYALSDTSYFEAYSTRWEQSVSAGNSGFHGNVIMRMLGGYLEPFRAAAHAPLLGHGVGMGTIAGARMATGSFTFALSEGELGRVVLELGPFLGFAFIIWRFWLAALLLALSWNKLKIQGDALPWLISVGAAMNLLFAQWGPSTHLGIAVFGAGLVLGALNDPPEPDEPEHPNDAPGHPISAPS